jgi:hypothetical protein
MNPFFTCPFAVLGLTICALMFFAASVTSGKGFYLENIQDKACNTLVDGSVTSGQKIRTEYTKMVDRMMCSAKCPCPPEDYSVWKNVPLDKLAQFERMDPYRSEFTEQMISDLNQNGFEADVAPMFFMDTNP